jgi:hypothetical protein
MHIKLQLENLKERDHFRDQGIDGRIILCGSERNRVDSSDSGYGVSCALL